MQSSCIRRISIKKIYHGLILIAVSFDLYLNVVIATLYCREREYLDDLGVKFQVWTIWLCLSTAFAFHTKIPTLIKTGNFMRISVWKKLTSNKKTLLRILSTFVTKFDGKTYFLVQNFHIHPTGSRNSLYGPGFKQTYLPRLITI